MGRQSRFNATGSSRWPGLVTKKLIYSRAQPAPKDAFRNTADTRPRRAMVRSGARGHLPLRQAHPVSL